MLTDTVNEKRPGRRTLLFVLHLVVLLLSVYLVVSISIDTFSGVDIYGPRFLHTQFYICLTFILDFFVELALSHHKWRFLRNNFLFLLVSVPYLPIFHWFNMHFAPTTAYLIQFIPLVRGGYALALVVGWFTYNRATSLFFTYLITLAATVYFGSLVFYLFEHTANKLVTGYGDALWWALMDMTTCGCEISPTTYVGRVLGVVLAALGMMMFPIFTVFITSRIKGRRTHERATMVESPGSVMDKLLNRSDDSSPAKPR